MILSNAYYMYANATPYRRVKNMKCFREIVIESLIGAPKQKQCMEPQANFHYLQLSLLLKKRKHPPEYVDTVQLKINERSLVINA